MSGLPPFTIKIRPVKSWERVDLRELWTTRELLFQLVKADISARHRQTLVGLSWGLLVPFTAMVVYSLVFGNLGKFPSDGVPYPIFFFAGYIVWQFFQRGLANAVMGFVGNPALITKVYFPRFHLLVAPIGTAAVDTLFGFSVLAGIYLFYWVLPPWQVVFLPVVLLMALATVVAFSLWLAPLNVDFRDIQMALPSMLQFVFFLSPIIFPVSFLPESLRLLSYINPLTTVLEAARWSLVGAPPPPLPGALISISVILIVMIPGAYYFAVKSRTLADRI